MGGVSVLEAAARGRPGCRGMEMIGLRQRMRASCLRARRFSFLSFDEDWIGWGGVREGW